LVVCVSGFFLFLFFFLYHILRRNFAESFKNFYFLNILGRPAGIYPYSICRMNSFFLSSLSWYNGQKEIIKILKLRF